MTTIQARSSRPSLPERRITRRRVTTTLLGAPGCVAAVACQSVEPTAARGEDRQLYRMNADGTGVTQLTRGGTPSFQPAWKP